MFFVLSKILAFLTKPSTWILIVLCLAVFNKRTGKKFLLFGLFMFFVFTNGFIHYEISRLWEIPPIGYEKLEKKYDVAVILGGISDFDGNYNMLKFNESSDRIIHAIKLYKQGFVKKILLSGGTGTMIGLDIREAPNLKKYLIEIGIIEKDIIIEKESRNTMENAKYSALILNRDFENGKFLLVTSAIHMRRSLLCFEKQGIKITAFSTDFSMSERKLYFDHLFLPEAQILNRWGNLFHEWIGYIVYSITFKISPSARITAISCCNF